MSLIRGWPRDGPATTATQTTGRRPSSRPVSALPRPGRPVAARVFTSPTTPSATAITPARSPIPKTRKPLRGAAIPSCALSGPSAKSTTARIPARRAASATREGLSMAPPFRGAAYHAPSKGCCARVVDCGPFPSGCESPDLERPARRAAGERRMDRMAELVEIEEIKQLKARYFRLMDEKRWDEWAEVFAED